MHECKVKAECQNKKPRCEALTTVHKWRKDRHELTKKTERAQGWDTHTS